MRNTWNQIPMLRITFSVIAGIALEIFADSGIHSSKELLPIALVLIGLSFFAVLAINFIKSMELSYRLRIANGVALTVLLVSLGYTLTWFHAAKNYNTHFQNFLQDENHIIAKITKPPLEKEKSVNAVAEVEEIKNNVYSVTANGKILISLIRDSASSGLRYGDVISFSTEVKEIDGPKNPEEFDYKTYQSFHNIYYRTFLTPGSWKLLQRGQGNILLSKIYDIRAYFLSLIERYVKDKNDFAVASAIMLGYNDYMNADVTRAYASSGTLHVLSVSGLHVGIMFLMLNFLLKGMDKRGRKFEIAKAVIIIVFIWFYACLTGLSPSVLRSAMMFSMIQGGKVMIRNVNTYNIVFGSALLLMLFNPFIITEVGFRLSYLAVIGIIYLYPKISALWVIGRPVNPKFKSQKNLFLKTVSLIRYDMKWLLLFVVDCSWQLAAVSIAAQLATLPLSLFYFHQMPNLFLISNLIVIPLSNLILFLGTALCAVGEIPFLNDLTGGIFNVLLMGLNKFIFFIDSLPFALIQGISITMAEMLLLYLLLLLVCWLFETPRPKVLLTSLLIVLMLSSFHSYKQITRAAQKKIVVYAVPKQSAIAFVEGSKIMTAFDDSLLNDQKNLLFHIKPHWWKCGINKETKIAGRQLDFGQLIVFEGKKVLVIDSTWRKNGFAGKEKLNVDMIILSHNPKLHLKDLENLAVFDELIFDSSNRKRRIDDWKKECLSLKIKCWDVMENGAFVWNAAI